MKKIIIKSNDKKQQTYYFPSVRFQKIRGLLLATFCSIILNLAYNNATHAATIDLVDFGINIDGAGVFPTMGDALPGEVDVSGFDENTGLGTLSVAISSNGSHFVGGFFDHEIDETINTFSNENGLAVGVPGIGQSWEIDEPGFFTGDIVSNFENSSALNGNLLDQKVGASVFGTAMFTDDMSMAMGWEFSLAGGETANINFILGTVVPSSFYLAHNDPDSDATIYFSSTLDIQGLTHPNPVPEPATILLVGFGILGIVVRRLLSEMKPAAGN